jgi:hypothetical protein
MIIISLTSDFGGHYRGIMHGVIKSIAPDVDVVELSSEVKAFDVKAGAYVLYSSYSYFPSGTIHLAVVDPMVGSERKAIAIKTERYIFVGPDNGVLMPAAKEDGIKEVRELSNMNLYRKYVSSTFHGRDIFAPVAAFLANGGDFEEVGENLESQVDLEFVKDVDAGGGAALCEVIFIDHFGNLTLSLREEDIKFEEGAQVRICGKVFKADRVNTYYRSKRGLILLVGSANFYELAVNEGSAAALTGARVGERVTITRI